VWTTSRARRPPRATCSTSGTPPSTTSRGRGAGRRRASGWPAGGPR
jgi:hypothetical protein